jgi:hypothetical protein
MQSPPNRALQRTARPGRTMTVIEITPHRWGWKAFESPGVEPVFPEKDRAVNYAQNCIWLFDL